MGLLRPARTCERHLTRRASPSADVSRWAELPLRQRPTRIYVSGGSVFIEGDELFRTVSPEDFLPVATPDPELGGETNRGDDSSQ